MMWVLQIFPACLGNKGVKHHCLNQWQAICTYLLTVDMMCISSGWHCLYKLFQSQSWILTVGDSRLMSPLVLTLITGLIHCLITWLTICKCHHYLIQYVMKIPMGYGLHCPNLGITAIAFVAFLTSIISHIVVLNEMSCSLSLIRLLPYIKGCCLCILPSIIDVVQYAIIIDLW